jgi:hypothetical protein
MARLFISYRRSDTGAYADRLAQRLSAFQFDSVFIDREAIDLGDDYADRIRSELSRCAAVLVLIGPGWFDAKDASGRRRLDDPADWVRREVAIALALDLKVMAVLFDSPRKPSQVQAELPPDMRALASRNDYGIDGNYFDRDADYLCRRLEQQLVTADRAAARPALSKGFLDQLKLIWMLLGAVTMGAMGATVAVPALPMMSWIFPGLMMSTAFSWWLFLGGESARAARGSMA